MKRCLLILMAMTLTAMPLTSQTFSLAIHGGAGGLIPKNFTPEREAKYREALDSALTIGYEMLKDSATSIEVCVAVVEYLENNPLFNAGRGSVFNSEGKHEMDASIMDGKTLNAGAVSGIGEAKNPIKVARTVMDSSEHVYLSGPGANAFAKEHGLETKPAEYFDVERRYKQWKRAREKEDILLDHDQDDAPDEEKKHGTVGAAALDVHGNVAAATSTGGMTNKKFGRVGDSPIIGAGSYANNQTCAVSCTGHGEYFIRTNAAFDVHALMMYKNLALQEACETVIHKRIAPLGGDGGMIAVDREGNIAFAFNTDGMYRGSVTQKGKKHIAIFGLSEK